MTRSRLKTTDVMKDENGRWFVIPEPDERRVRSAMRALEAVSNPETEDIHE